MKYQIDVESRRGDRIVLRLMLVRQFVKMGSDENGTTALHGVEPSRSASTVLNNGINLNNLNTAVI
jgi:hypothetical protein